MNPAELAPFLRPSRSRPGSVRHRAPLRVLAVTLVILTGCVTGQAASAAPPVVPLTVADLRARAERGDPEAQFRLGLAYQEGREVPRDPAQAAIWYRKAAEQDHAGAQHNLGTLYGHGSGVPRDFEQAAFWCLKAARQGHPMAQSKVGYMYEMGMGLPEDSAQAARWYEAAARQGDPVAALNLGLLYRQGAGVGQDLVMAHTLFAVAAARSEGATQGRAIASMAAVDQRLTPQQQALAEQRARQWPEPVNP